MNKFGLYSDRSAIPFEKHLEGLEEETKTLLSNLRLLFSPIGNPPLNIEQFNTVWYEIERRIPYIKNHLTSCFCPEHKESKITKLYDFEAQKMIYKDFTDNDIPRIGLLYHLESLLEDKNNSVDQIRKLLLEYNEHLGDDKLSLDTLQYIWDVAVIQDKIFQNLLFENPSQCDDYFHFLRRIAWKNWIDLFMSIAN